MATNTWIGTTNSWNTSGNWSGGIPTASDDVIFDASGNNPCTLDINAEAQSIDFQPSYTANFDAATFNVECENITISSGGTIDLGSGIWTISGNWDASGFTGGVWTYGTSTTILTGDAKTINVNSITRKFYQLTISGDTASIYAGSLYSYGDLTIDDGKTLTMSGSLWCYKNITIAGEWTGNSVMYWIGGSGYTLDASAGVISVARIYVYFDGGTLTPATYDCQFRFFATSASRTGTLSAGNYIFNDDLYFNPSTSGDIIVNAVSGTNIECVEDVIWLEAGTGTATFNKSDGTILFSGTGQNIDWDDQDLGLVDVSGTITLDNDLTISNDSTGISNITQGAYRIKYIVPDATDGGIVGGVGAISQNWLIAMINPTYDVSNFLLSVPIGGVAGDLPLTTTYNGVEVPNNTTTYDGGLLLIQSKVDLSTTTENKYEVKS